MEHAQVYTIINGVIFKLPPEAKYVMQSARGQWFWTKRKPRLKGNDWTPKKHPVQYRTTQGHIRVAQSTPPEDFTQTEAQVLVKKA